MPAQAGIHFSEEAEYQIKKRSLDSRLRGNDETTVTLARIDLS